LLTVPVVTILKSDLQATPLLVSPIAFVQQTSFLSGLTDAAASTTAVKATDTVHKKLLVARKQQVYSIWILHLWQYLLIAIAFLQQKTLLK
jgi:hypothetical protein